MKPLLEGYKAIKNLNPKMALKALADAYLIYKFAISPTVSDASKLNKRSSGVLARLLDPKAFRSRRRAKDDCPFPATWYSTPGTITLSTTFRLRARTELIARLVIGLDQLGFLPSPKNVWALVPFSFVVDWFLNLADVFEAYRYERDAYHFNLLARVESHKIHFDWSDEFIELAVGSWVTTDGPIEGIIYDRYVYSDWGSFDPLSLAGGGGLSLGQITSGGVLILQKALS